MSAPSYSDSPRNATNYLGQNYRFTPTYIRQRNPVNGTSQTNLGDIKPKENQGRYPIGSIWINTSTPPEIWILASMSSNGAEWVLIANSLITGPILTLTDDSGAIVHPTSDVSNPPGNIQFKAGSGIGIVGTDPGVMTITNTGVMGDFAPDTGTNPVSGATVTLTNTSILATGTLANAIRSNGTGASTLAYQVQYAGANASVSAGSKWGVAQFDSNQFSVASGFVQLAGGTTAPILGITPDAHTAPGTTPVVPNGSGNIILEGGATFATGTQANPIRTNSLAANTIDLQIQLAGSNAAVSTANNFGVAQFDSNSFTVTNGFVALAAGGTDVQTLTGNSGGAISPSAGNIDIKGTGNITVVGTPNTLTPQLTGLTNHNVLVGATSATITNVAPSATSGVPLISQGAAADPAFGTAVVAGGGTGDTSFTAYSVICGGTTSTNPLQNVSGVGTSGQVLTSNGAAMLPTWQTAAQVTQFTLDAATSPIFPSAGNITLTGGQVATGTVGANVIRTRGNTGSSCTVEIQRSTVAGVANSALNGVCHFDSSKFSVDANGFVTFTGSTSNIPWTDEGGNFNAASNQGYFCTAVLTATLPPTPAQGDVVRIVVDTASVVTVTANTGQKIRIGNVISSLAGTAASTKQGDSLDLVYRSASAVWYEVGGAQGSWSIT